MAPLGRNRLILTALCALVLSITISAVAIADSYEGDPYNGYTYDFWAEPVVAPQAYLPAEVIDGKSLGVGEFSSPTDIFVDDDDTVFILDTGNNRIVCLDKDWQVLRVIESFTNGDQEDTFSEPKGLYVTDEGSIYVADRGNSRIVQLTKSGEFIREIGPPKTDVAGVLPEDFIYRPTKVAVDRAGRIYVLAEGVYDGIIEFDVDGNFEGFMGAPRVRPSIADIIWSRLATREQKKRMVLFLPTEYAAIDLDERGFIFATEKNEIRRLNPTGVDVLRRNGFFDPVGDVAVDEDHKKSEEIASSYFVDVAARQEGMYSVLDRSRGRVFTYDENGRLLYLFGGLGNTTALFRSPVALDELGDRILVLDRGYNRFAVFAPTEYARCIHAAIHLHREGLYDESAAMWGKVLQANVNHDLAYTGIGRARLRQGKYREAMVNFRLGSNREDYSEAFQLYRKQVVARNFGWFVAALFAVGFVIYFIRKYHLMGRLRRFLLGGDVLNGPGEVAAARSARTGTIMAVVRKTVDSLSYSRHVIFHPFDGFWDLKREGRGTLPAAAILVAALCATYVFMRQYTGFIFNPRDLTELNIFLEITSVLVPFFLWCAVNWALTTLMDGKGRFRDIVIATAFAMTPLILINVPMTIISNYITVEEGAFYYFFLALAVVWSMGLLFFGTAVTHDYDMGKNFWTTVMTVVGMGTVLFISLLFFSVMNLVVGFMSSVYTELVLRL